VILEKSQIIWDVTQCWVNSAYLQGHLVQEEIGMLDAEVQAAEDLNVCHITPNTVHLGYCS